MQYGIVGSRSPLWKTDLRPLGFYVDEHNPTGVITAINQIAFGNDGELVVITDRGFRPKEPNPVRAYVLESTTGKVLNQTDWVTKGWPYIFATATGRYVVNTFDGLALYSPGLEQNLATYDNAAKMASPDGRAITVWSGVPGRAVTTFLDADTLQSTGAEFINRAVDSAAFNRIAYVAFRSIKSNASVSAGEAAQKFSPYASVFIGDTDQKFSPYDTECKEVRPRFISQDLLAVFGCKRMDVISVEGDLLFTTSMSEADHWVTPASRNGHRFAIISTYESSAHWPKTCFERVRVFDVNTGNVIFKTEIRELGGTEGGSGIALSPDGSLLAVNSLGIVQVFKLSSTDIPSSKNLTTSGN